MCFFDRGLPVLFVLLSFLQNQIAAFSSHAYRSQKWLCDNKAPIVVLQATHGLWEDFDGKFALPKDASPPVSIDSVLDSSTPDFSTAVPTLFRERHGWCPYSERVWLTLELAQIDYDTVRIDNTGGPRPRYYAGQTPQLRWPDGKTQGESMDLVDALDQTYNQGRFQSNDSDVKNLVRKFSSIFPRARPSSRAAYLFQMNGEPLWKSTFETTLQQTDELLAQTSQQGPYFAGAKLTTADIAWAPFLERYRYQLPCLHEGLNPADPVQYPHLSRWYQAMDEIPEYACRVKGDASSWRKVLTMAGFGNSGVPSNVQGNMDNLLAKEEEEATLMIQTLDVWSAYAKDRPWVQSSPFEEAAAIITRNREAILTDLVKQASKPAWKGWNLPTSEEEAESALVALVETLLQLKEGEPASDLSTIGPLASFLDERMCVPRDMGAMAAATLKTLASQARRGEA